MSILPNTHVKLLFPTMLYQDHISITEEYREELIQYIRERVQKLDRAKSEFDVLTTYFHDDDRLNPLFDEIIGKIDEHVEIFCKEVGIPMEASQFNKTFWSTISQYGQCHFTHHHGSSKISGCYYLQIPKDKPLSLLFQGTHGLNRFEEKFKVDKEDPHYSLHSDEHEEPLDTDKILLFNGGTLHGYMPNPSKQDKITIAFNYGY